MSGRVPKLQTISLIIAWLKNLKGISIATVSQSIIPNEYTSTEKLYVRLFATSGAIYRMDPVLPVSRYVSLASLSSECNSFANPKSNTFTTFFTSKPIFSGFMSRYMTLRSCKCCMAEAMFLATVRRSANNRFFFVLLPLLNMAKQVVEFFSSSCQSSILSSRVSYSRSKTMK